MITVEKERKIKTISLIALIIAVVGLTVAFASLSTTLTVNGSASVDSASWDIHFDENSLSLVTEGAGSLNENLTISGTTISGMNMTITKPNDFAGFEINIVNESTLDGKLNSIIKPTLCTLQSPVESCDWNNDNVVTQEDIDKVNENIVFLTIIGDDNNLKEGDLLKAGDTIQIAFGLYYGSYYEGPNALDDNATELPKRNLEFNNLSLTLNFVQAD